jgi:hypothetical protein
VQWRLPCTVLKGRTAANAANSATCKRRDLCFVVFQTGAVLPSTGPSAVADTAVTVTSVHFLRRFSTSFFLSFFLSLSLSVCLDLSIYYLFIATDPLKPERGTVAAISSVSQLHCYLLLHGISLQGHFLLHCEHEKCWQNGCWSEAMLTLCRGTKECSLTSAAICRYIVKLCGQRWTLQYRLCVYCTAIFACS